MFVCASALISDQFHDEDDKEQLNYAWMHQAGRACARSCTYRSPCDLMKYIINRVCISGMFLKHVNDELISSYQEINKFYMVPHQ